MKGKIIKEDDVRRKRRKRGRRRVEVGGGGGRGEGGDGRRVNRYGGKKERRMEGE